jgi:cyclopropane-fatty-acyl-phospholipid synthase
VSFALGAALAERGLVPDPLVRSGIRSLLGGRLRDERRRDPGSAAARIARWREATAGAPLAPRPEAANEQHYELPAEFFRLVLGPRSKYSSCLWPGGVATLAAAEEAMLALSAERAEIADGQTVLDLGCGWGAMSLWLAERFPDARIVAISNSKPQGDYLRARAAECGLGNVEHRVADVNALELPAGGFDRIVSIEMFEHLRNYALLFERLERWLAPGGKLFVHVFCHRELAYPFEDRGASDWMARHFFTGGVMPSADLLPAFAGALDLEERWLVPGTHYARTAEAWLDNLDARRAEALAILERAYGRDARRWLARWRLFFLACAELFGYRGGEEWLVAHYRFAKAVRTPGEPR